MQIKTKDKIVQAVLRKMDERSIIGQEKYGATMMEEIGELGQAILKDDEAEFIDAIGDSVVVLTNLAKLGGHDIERCIESAYSEISARSGSMVNGTFVKDAN